MLSPKAIQFIAAVLGIALAAAVANLYLELGWFGGEARLVVSILVLLTCILAALAFKRDERGQTKKQ